TDCPQTGRDQRRPAAHRRDDLPAVRVAPDRLPQSRDHAAGGVRSTPLERRLPSELYEEFVGSTRRLPISRNASASASTMGPPTAGELPAACLRSEQPRNQDVLRFALELFNLSQ